MLRWFAFPPPPFLKSLIRNLIGTTHSRIGPVCINPSNNLTYVDISNGIVKDYFRENAGLKGLKKVKYFNFQNNGILLTPQKCHFSRIRPLWKYYCLDKITYTVSLEFPEKMDFLQVSTLRSLDIQGCSLMVIPEKSLQ